MDSVTPKAITGRVKTIDNFQVLSRQQAAPNFLQITLQCQNPYQTTSDESQSECVVDFVCLEDKKFPLHWGSANTAQIYVHENQASLFTVLAQLCVQRQSWLWQSDVQILLMNALSVFHLPSILQQLEQSQSASSLRDSLIVIAESEHTWPFRPAPSRLVLPYVPSDVIACIPLLEDKGIPSRLCHTEMQPGCFEGSTDELLTNAVLPSLTKKNVVPEIIKIV
ncbi:MAG: hypothetical protein AAGB12_04840 [Pseudomonadota bacterium]